MTPHPNEQEIERAFDAGALTEAELDALALVIPPFTTQLIVKIHW